MLTVATETMDDFITQAAFGIEPFNSSWSVLGKDSVFWQFSGGKMLNYFFTRQCSYTTCVCHDRRNNERVMNREILWYLLWHTGFSWSFWGFLDHSFLHKQLTNSFKSESQEMLSAMKRLDTICTRKLGLSWACIRLFLSCPMLEMWAEVPRTHIGDLWPRHWGER